MPKPDKTDCYCRDLPRQLKGAYSCHWCVNGIIEAKNALVRENGKLRAGLLRIACYGEGPVSGSMDEPAAARVAREALEGKGS